MFFNSSLRARDTPAGNFKDIKRTQKEGKGAKARDICYLLDQYILLDFSLASSWTDGKAGRATKTAAGMKYNYNVPVSTYTRTSQYTPSYHTPTYYTPSLYKPTQYTSTYASATKYTPTQYTPTQYSKTQYSPTQYSTTHYTPSHYTSTYKTASTYVPSYSKPSRYSSTRRTQAQEPPAPVIPVAPAKRTVHFPNDIIFQDIVRRGDMEQIGRFMRARKVRVDTLFHSGEQSASEM